MSIKLCEPLEKSCRRHTARKHENAKRTLVIGLGRLLAGLVVTEGDGFQEPVALNPHDAREVPDVDLVALGHLLCNRGLRPQVILANDHGHLTGELGKKQRLLRSGVTATDDKDLLVSVEHAVTGRAV